MSSTDHLGIHVHIAVIDRAQPAAERVITIAAVAILDRAQDDRLSVDKRLQIIRRCQSFRTAFAPVSGASIPISRIRCFLIQT